VLTALKTTGQGLDGSTHSVTHAQEATGCANPASRIYTPQGRNDIILI